MCSQQSISISIIYDRHRWNPSVFNGARGESFQKFKEKRKGSTVFYKKELGSTKKGGGTLKREVFRISCFNFIFHQMLVPIDENDSGHNIF